MSFSDPVQVEWANSFIGLLNELAVYVKKNHTTGLWWNPNGVGFGFGDLNF